MSYFNCQRVSERHKFSVMYVSARLHASRARLSVPGPIVPVGIRIRTSHTKFLAEILSAPAFTVPVALGRPAPQPRSRGRF
jgi:hypothetical protein